MRWRRPEGLQQLDPGAATQLARLTALEGFARSIIVGVVPLAALDALGSKAAVSYAFFGGAALTLLITLNIGRLERAVQRRWVMMIGAGLLVAAASMYAVVDGPLFAIAIGFHSTAASIFSVCLSLYIMDFIGKAELTTTESRRMLYNGAAWFVGPTIGGWLWSHSMGAVPFIVSIVTTTLMVAYFWRLRIHANPVLRGPTRSVTRPWHNIVRYFGQRYLRCAYAITTARAIFWATLFVYGPIYVIEASLPTWAAGVFLSAASATLFLSPLVSRVADRFGLRNTIVGAFVLMAASMVGLAVLREARPIGVAFWLLGALGGSTIDVLGNIPFMRLVKPRERGAMTTVFSTWREVSFLLAPLIAAAALALGEFWYLYATLAVVLAGGACATTFLPRRL
ncbi:MAG: MFS transporter [Ilumatobacter sp.]|uniref:MFS transporter n=1 Tax=Ilumatobacter sp. TaxID=1967498 RepID=UPI0032998131